MNFKKTEAIAFLYFILFIQLIFSQKNNDRKEINNWFDEKVGLENTSIFNGRLDNGAGYFERKSSYKGTQRYFDSFDFFEGSILYGGEEYFGIQMKYDLYEGGLLLNLKNRQGMYIPIRPINRMIESFSFKGHFFININKYRVNDENVNGFAEILHKTPVYILFKKHKKHLKTKVNGDRILFEFKSNNFNFLYYKNSFFAISSRKDLVNIFPKFKKEINSFEIKKLKSDDDMIKLLDYLNSFIMSKDIVK